MQELRKCANTDKVYQQLKNYITSGFPDHRHMVPDECKAYWQIRQHLSVEEELISGIWVSPCHTTPNES